MDPGWKFNEADKKVAVELQNFLPETDIISGDF